MKNSSFNKILILAILLLFVITNIALAQIHYDSSGNVGIGTTEPFYNLDVAGDINFTGNLYKNGTAFEGEGSLWTESGENIYRSSGNVGIGTTSPGHQLQIGSRVWMDGNVTGQGLVRTDNIDLDGIIYDNDSPYVTVSDGITITGNVGIGTTSPSYKVEVVGAQLIKPDSNWNPGDEAYLYLGKYDHYIKSSYSGNDKLKSYAGWEFATGYGSTGTVRMIITQNGSVGVGTTTPSYKLHVVGDIAYTGNIYDVSDIRRKENITSIQDALEKVSAINGIYFNNIGEPENREVGVIAQEVETVLPEVVSEDVEGYKSVDYSKFTPLLIEAVKELKAENEALKARISVLEAALQQ